MNVNVDIYIKNIDIYINWDVATQVVTSALHVHGRHCATTGDILLHISFAAVSLSVLNLGHLECQ